MVRHLRGNENSCFQCNQARNLLPKLHHIVCDFNKQWPMVTKKVA
jgi:hypothetical protein